MGSVVCQLGHVVALTMETKNIWNKLNIKGRKFQGKTTTIYSEVKTTPVPRKYYLNLNWVAFISSSEIGLKAVIRDGSKAAAKSKIERFVIIANGWKPLTIIKNRSILDVAAAVDPPLVIFKTLTFI